MEEPVICRKGEKIKNLFFPTGAVCDLLIKTNVLNVVLNVVMPKETIKAANVHKGEEVHYILQGELQFHVGDKKFRMNEGDTIWFNSEVPHSVSNNTGSSCRFFTVWVNPARY